MLTKSKGVPVGKPRARPVEILVAVGDVYAAGADGAKHIPLRPRRQRSHFGTGAGLVETTRQDRDDVGIGCLQLLERHPRRVAPGSAE